MAPPSCCARSRVGVDQVGDPPVAGGGAADRDRQRAALPDGAEERRPQRALADQLVDVLDREQVLERRRQLLRAAEQRGARPVRGGELGRVDGRAARQGGGAGGAHGCSGVRREANGGERGAGAGREASGSRRRAEGLAAAAGPVGSGAGAVRAGGVRAGRVDLGVVAVAGVGVAAAGPGSEPAGSEPAGSTWVSLLSPESASPPGPVIVGLVVMSSSRSVTLVLQGRCGAAKSRPAALPSGGATQAARVGGTRRAGEGHDHRCRFVSRPCCGQRPARPSCPRHRGPDPDRDGRRVRATARTIWG